MRKLSQYLEGLTLIGALLLVGALFGYMLRAIC